MYTTRELIIDTIGFIAMITLLLGGFSFLFVAFPNGWELY